MSELIRQGNPAIQLPVIHVNLFGATSYIPVPYLSWDEGRELLKDRLTVIKTDGQAIVNTDLEMEFDTNSDGVIDRREASAILKALQE